MLSDETIERVTERLVTRIEDINLYIIRKIAKKLKEIRDIDPTDAHQLVKIMQYGGDYDKIVKKLAKITKINTKEIQKIFKEAAKKDYEFAEQFYKYRNKKYIPFEENIILQRQIDAIAVQTTEQYVNFSKTTGIGFSIRDRENNVIFRSVTDTYKDSIDRAILSISQGKASYDEEIYNIMKSIGTSGLKYMDYETGKHRRLDSSLRMAIKDGLRQLSIENQMLFGREFDADGVEITVHGYPAPDHAEVQGRQFRLDQFDNFQNDKDCVDITGKVFEAEYDDRDRRSIGQYNCYHGILNIIVGVNKPQYTDEELQKIIDENEEGFDYEGKHYTLYEGTQLQRRLEAEIRKQKDLQIMAKDGDSDKLAVEAQKKIDILTQKYNKLSKISKLPTKVQRLQVPDYREIKLTGNNASKKR